MTHFVFRIGPIDTKQGPVSSYYVVPGRDKANAFVAPDDRAGLRQVAAAFAPEEIECEPALAAAAAELGIRPGEITPERAHAIGVVAFEMAGKRIGLLEHEGLIYQLGKACAAFWKAKPWERPFAVHTLDVEISGAVDAELEGAIMGRGGTQFGLALYPEQGSRQRIRDLAAQGKQLEAASIATLGVGFVDGKEYLVDAMERAYGLRKLPQPFKIHEGDNVVLGDLDVAALAASLLAVVDMSDERPRARRGVRVGPIEVWATAKLADA